MDDDGMEDIITSLPACPYGESCYRKNPEHFRLYTHPSSSAPIASPLTRADTWPSTTTSSSSSSASSGAPSTPVQITPYIDLADEYETQQHSKKRKVEHDDKEKSAEIKAKIQQIVDLHTIKLSALLEKHKKEIQEMTKVHNEELLRVFSLDGFKQDEKDEDDVSDLLHSPLATNKNTNGRHTEPKVYRASSFTEPKRPATPSTPSRTFTTPKSTPNSFTNNNNNSNHQSNNSTSNGKTKYHAPNTVSRGNSQLHSKPKPVQILINDDYSDEGGDESSDGASQVYSIYPNTENLKPKGRLNNGALDTGTSDGELSDEQKSILESALQGTSLFYTGPAGTGKSFMLEHVVNGLKRINKTIFLTAPTGVAASNIGGTTIHSFAGVGLGEADEEKLYYQVLNSPIARDNWLDANVLVIDEISMLSGVLFDKLNYVAKRIRENDAPFGGIQLILVGDFFQLSPIHDKTKQFVEDTEEMEDRSNGVVRKKPYVSLKRALFCFETQSWAETIKEMHQLTKVFRQGDTKVVKMLSDDIRFGTCSTASATLLHSRVHAVLPDDDGIKPTTLYPFNKEVSTENMRCLNEITEDQYDYYADDKIYCYKADYKKSLRFQQELALKVGAQVMLLRNINSSLDLINGSRGVVIGFEHYTKVYDRDLKPFEDLGPVDNKRMSFPNDRSYKWMQKHPYLPIVKFVKITCIVTPEIYEVEVGQKIRADRYQIPLNLAWAITVHKSQGMTLDKVEMHLAKAFSTGMVYVALSRVRSLEGLSLGSFNPSKITADPIVLAWWSEHFVKDNACI